MVRAGGATGKRDCRPDPHLWNPGLPSVPACQKKAFSGVSKARGLRVASLDTDTSV